ncbi:MAG: hypothetical protein WCP36_09875 [Methanomicrobiales archaeon]
MYAGELANSYENAGYLNLVLRVEVLAGEIWTYDHLHSFTPDCPPDRKIPKKGYSTVEKVAFAEPGKG